MGIHLNKGGLLQLKISTSKHCSHNLRKFPQIYAVSMGVVLVIMRV